MVATTERDKTGGARKQSTKGRRKRYLQNEGIIPQLALAVREVEASAQRGKATAANRTRFHVVALLMREERTRIKTATDVPEAEKAETLKRLDGIAAILAKAAANDTSLIPLLEPEAPITEATLTLKRKMQEQGGIAVDEDTVPVLPAGVAGVAGVAIAQHDAAAAEKQVTPQGLQTRLRTNPFLAPVFPVAERSVPVVRLANWELISPLLKSFEMGGATAATMALPAAPTRDRIAPAGTELMAHQAQFLAAVAAGHRSFLLADEPGLGKTAQSLLAASVAGTYPLLVVAPNVVKMNWAREAKKWTPQRRVTVITGDGADIDVFADIFVINYDILDRHLGWLSSFGFKGMVVDEAHMIKNVTSQRSRNVLALAEQVRQQAGAGQALLIALTGTPLINDIDDFRAIWRFLGWIDADKPGAELLQQLERNGYTPADGAFYPAARQAVVDLGIVRRRKIDVAKDLPAKSVIDIPVELDENRAPGIHAAEKQLADKLYNRYLQLRTGKLGEKLSEEQLLRTVALQELELDADSGGMNVFAMVRQIGLAKTELAVDYAAQLARSVGKVVFFAKHIEVMDRAVAEFESRGLGVATIRGNQSAAERQQQIDLFQNDPETQVIVCSLTAAGVGVNLQAASNVVLAELSWTDAEQTQAIDRVHRIGQEEPVTAWRIVAAQTVDQRIAELIDAKAGLAARALDGAAAKDENADPVQLTVLIEVLRAEIAKRQCQLEEI
ncbi:DEAD/DEAH box helicase [Leucobacter sp. OH2974_COT-288]|uniref:Superfamily II DNA or RNA helicase n=1 Tax=Canibacter oris TaxID=1365628 RepID=A0A840DP85_9MICO|nr:superfamily II DNA or RNA helicase [Canibacter oris]RRD36488.1 DEAD/DEAH box helicase [Leucobacter sp. OH2974_COT-288]